MKCTYSDSGAFAGAGAVRNVHCAVCRVQCAACLIQFSKSFCVTPPSGCRMSANSTFLVIDMKSMCKHLPEDGDKH